MNSPRQRLIRYGCASHIDSINHRLINRQNSNHCGYTSRKWFKNQWVNLVKLSSEHSLFKQRLPLPFMISASSGRLINFIPINLLNITDCTRDC